MIVAAPHVALRHNGQSMELMVLCCYAHAVIREVSSVTEVSPLIVDFDVHGKRAWCAKMQSYVRKRVTTYTQAICCLRVSVTHMLIANHLPQSATSAKLLVIFLPPERPPSDRRGLVICSLIPEVCRQHNDGNSVQNHDYVWCRHFGLAMRDYARVN